MNKTKKILLGFTLTIAFVLIAIVGIHQILANQVTKESEVSELLRGSDEVNAELLGIEETAKSARSQMVSAARQALVGLSDEKDLIKAKMMNARFFYDGVIGKYVTTIYSIDANGKMQKDYFDLKVDFAIDNENMQGVSKNLVKQSSGSSSETIDLTDGPTTLRIDNSVEGEIQKVINTGYFESITFNESQKSQILDINRTVLASQGIETLAIGLLEPQQLAMWLDNTNEWEISSKTKCFGRDAYVIEGTFKGEEWVRTDRESFKIVVDKATGVVYESEIKNKDGETTSIDKFEEISIFENNNGGKYSIVSKEILQDTLKNLKTDRVVDYTKEANELIKKVK